MNILYLAHRVPYPPNKGDKLRAFRHIEHLAKNHRVWCACFVDDPKDQPHADALRNWCEQVIAIPLERRSARVRAALSLAAGGTATEGFYRSRDMVRRLADWCRQVAFDRVIAFSSSMAPYAALVPAQRRVLDLCDVDSEKWRQYAAFRRGPWGWLYAVEASRLLRAECRMVQTFDAVILATKPEAELLLRRLASICGDAVAGLTSRIHVVGNGTKRQADQSASATTSPVVGFVGTMDYWPNVDAVTWFAHQIWPMIRRRHPDAEFRIVGRSPTRDVQRLGQSAGVCVVGEVDDITEALRGFSVSVAPLRIGRGVQNKVLEAMACARPVVLTTAAAEGLELRDRRDCLIADTPEAVATCVCSLLADPQLRRQVGLRGREYVWEHHAWSRHLAALDGVVGSPTAAISPAKVLAG